MQWPRDVPDEITQKNEASLEKAEDEQVTLGVCCGDFSAEFTNPRLNRCRVKDDALYSASVEARVGGMNR